MVLSMKIISFSFDAEKGVTAEFPGVLEYSGYVLCPSSIIFGPFMMYKDYCQILHHRPLVRVCRNILYALLNIYSSYKSRTRCQ
jgi:hypothetical protein